MFKIDFARLNHVFIPSSSEARDRLRRGAIGRAAAPIAWAWGSLTDEGRTLAPVTLLVGALAVDVRETAAYALFCALVGLLVGSLAAARGLRLDGAVVRVDAPRRVTLGQPVTFAIAVRAAGARALLRVRGPFLPWDGAWLARAPAEIALAPGRDARATMVARFAARGVHHLDPFTAAAIAPLGLACGPRASSDAVKVTVVPRVANVVRLSSAVAARHQPGGVALASKTGESMDLLGVRPYRPGDPVRDLHARSWARTGFPVVREYVQEHFTRVGVVLDTDVEDPDLLEASIELAAGIVARLSRGEALVDVLVVGERVHELVLGRSLGTLDQALDLLATVERGPPLRAIALARRLEPYLERLSSVIVVAHGAGGEGALFEAEARRRGVAPTTIVLDAELARAVCANEPLTW